MSKKSTFDLTLKCKNCTQKTKFTFERGTIVQPLSGLESMQAFMKVGGKHLVCPVCGVAALYRP